MAYDHGGLKALVRANHTLTLECLHLLPPYSPELNPQENIWDEIREKIFKNYALKSMDDVNAKLDKAAFTSNATKRSSNPSPHSPT